MTYATSNNLGGDAFARNVTDAWIDGWITDRLLVRIYYIFSLRKNTRLNQLMPYDIVTKMPHDFLGPVEFCLVGCLVVTFIFI